MSEQPMTDSDGSASEWTEEASAMSQGKARTPGGSADGYAPAELENLQAESAAGRAEVNLEAIVDIPVTLSVEIGQTTLSIRNLLQLNRAKHEI